MSSIGEPCIRSFLGGSWIVYASSMGACQRGFEENARIPTGWRSSRRAIRGGMVNVCRDAKVVCFGPSHIYELLASESALLIGTSFCI